MKYSKLLCVWVGVIVLLSSCSKSKDPAPERPLDKKLIAHYPLTSDGIDVTGNNGPMLLQNTPFQNGGIYCNGIYSYSSDPDFCLAQTPPINELNFESLSISMDFYVSEKKTQPVWVIGTSCRWLGFYLYDDGTVTLLYNNWDVLTTSKTYSLNEWHNGKVTFDGTTVSIFLDDNLAGSLKFGDGYVPLNSTGCGTSDTEIGVTNFSNGHVFKGHARNLEVYSPQ